MKTIDMTHGKILPLLLQYSLPILCSELLQQLYSTVDTILVGNLVGMQAMASVGGTEAITKLLIGFSNGFSVGCTIITANAFGAKDTERLKRSVCTILILAFCLGIGLSAFCYVMSPYLLRLCATPESIFPLALSYLRIYFCGTLGFILYSTISGILRAVGNVKFPFLILMLASASNVALDLIFLSFFNGVEAVAYATVLSQGFAAVWCLWIITHTKESFQFLPHSVSFDVGIAKQVFSIGIPGGVQRTVISFSNFFVLSFINQFGEACLAGWVIYMKLNHYTLVALQSIGSSTSAFVGQNMGAGCYERIRRGVRIAFLISLLACISLSVLFWLYYRPLIALFGDDPAMYQYASLFIQSLSLLQLLMVGQPLYSAVLHGMRKNVSTTIFMLLSLVGIRQIYLLIVTHFIKTPLVIGLSFPVGWLACSITMYAYYRFNVRRFPSSVLSPAKKDVFY